MQKLSLRASFRIWGEKKNIILHACYYNAKPQPKQKKKQNITLCDSCLSGAIFHCHVIKFTGTETPLTSTGLRYINKTGRFLEAKKNTAERSKLVPSTAMFKRSFIYLFLAFIVSPVRVEWINLFEQQIDRSSAT